MICIITSGMLTMANGVVKYDPVQKRLATVKYRSRSWISPERHTKRHIFLFRSETRHPTYSLNQYLFIRKAKCI